MRAGVASGPHHPIMKNKFQSTCELCGGIVKANEGSMQKVGGRWRVVHALAMDCQAHKDAVARGQSNQVMAGIRRQQDEINSVEDGYTDFDYRDFNPDEGDRG